jgi:hypothetical protein
MSLHTLTETTIAVPNVTTQAISPLASLRME